MIPHPLRLPPHRLHPPQHWVHARHTLIPCHRFLPHPRHRPTIFSCAAQTSNVAIVHLLEDEIEW